MTTTSQTPKRGKTAEPRRESLLTDFALVPISIEERRLAALAVCARSETADEAREYYHRAVETMRGFVAEAPEAFVAVDELARFLASSPDPQ